MEKGAWRLSLWPRWGDARHRHSAWLRSLVLPVCARENWSREGDPREPRRWWAAGAVAAAILTGHPKTSWLKTVTLSVGRESGNGLNGWSRLQIIHNATVRLLAEALVTRRLDGAGGSQVGPLTWNGQAASGPHPVDPPRGWSPPRG